MVIRGAPAIGVAAAMGVALGVLHAAERPALGRRSSTRSARHWRHAAHRSQSVLGHRPHEAAVPPRAPASRSRNIRRRLIEEAQQMREEDIAIYRAIGRNGAALVPDGRPC